MTEAKAVDPDQRNVSLADEAVVKEVAVLPGSKTQACRHQGSPGTWETCSFPAYAVGFEGSAETETSRSAIRHPGLTGAKRRMHRLVWPEQTQ
jgi:hypothetical protein